jgi:hypothetical protein
MFDTELLLITSMIEFTITLDAVFVSAKTKNSNRRCHAGKVTVTKKNHIVIDAGFGQDSLVNCLYIMWTETSTMFHYETCVQFVETVWKKLLGLKLLGGRVILNQTLDLLV